VDDDPDMLELVRLTLTDAGFSVRTAANGQEALRKAQRSPPDLVILDLLLPGMNGFSVCEQLRLNRGSCCSAGAGCQRSFPDSSSTISRAGHVCPLRRARQLDALRPGVVLRSRLDSVVEEPQMGIIGRLWLCV
jgi:CheY-like chemotaxis protein